MNRRTTYHRNYYHAHLAERRAAARLNRWKFRQRQRIPKGSAIRLWR
jgi:hypothetical protein